MSPAPQSKGGKDSVTARLLGSGTSGILELLGIVSLTIGFHPVDTVAKRLMNNKLKVQYY